MITKSSFKKEKYNIEDLLDITRILREPDGCPWDREQTHKSIRKDLLEEAYEVADAIDSDDSDALCEELGDLLLQVTMHSQMATENSDFDFNDVADGICKKLISRHPHVFGSVNVENTEEVLYNWDNIKRDEKHQESYTDTLISVPKAFPALMRAGKVQKRASKAGFDWESVNGAFAKLHEETVELETAIKSQNNDEIAEEYGDLLFAAVNVARFLKIDPEFSLNNATEKFIRRFSAVENEVLKSGKDMKDLSLAELDNIWNSIKHKV
jgi:tetrapyrrole methylase family protein/MazG family protein